MAEIRADAPGRVNLIGEHTDYHDGFVMPCAIPMRTYVALTPRGDTRVRLTSAQFAGVIEYDIGQERRRGNWGDLIQGLTAVIVAGNHHVSGFELLVQSDVPVGSGLSSSAALEISTLRAIRSAFDLPLSDVDLARMGQRAEAEFAGAAVGIMDQMASSFADQRTALFLDTRTLDFERLPLPADLELVVIDSGVAHHHGGGPYMTRRRESQSAARLLGVTVLRDASPEALDRLATLPSLLARRARHVITENTRVIRARQALLESDLAQFGVLLNASHASLRDDYEVSIAEVDLLVELTQAQPGVYGARMTGGGFGGAIVAAVAAGRGRSVGEAVATQYRTRTNRTAPMFVMGET